MSQPLTCGIPRGTLHSMRMSTIIGLVAAVAGLAACGDDDRTQNPPVAAGGSVQPEKVAGTYELWICSSSECGPGTTMAGTRFGRLVLDTKASPAATDSVPAFGGCIHIGQLQQFDRSPTLRTIAWSPTQTPGEIGFTGDRNSEGDYEISLNDLGGMMRGRARWRRDGVFGEETPDFIVARKLDRVNSVCPEPNSTAATTDGAATSAAANAVKGATGVKSAGKQGKATAPAAKKP